MLEEGQALARDLLDQRQERLGSDGNAGARVVQKKFVVIGAKKGVDRNRNGTDFDGAEKRVSEFGDIRKQQEHAFFDANMQRPTQSCAEAIDAFGELRISDALILTFDGDALASAFAEMAVDKIFAGIERVLGLFGRDGHEGRVYLSARQLRF